MFVEDDNAGDRGRPRDVDEFDDPEPRSARRKADPAPNTSSVRNEWEPQCASIAALSYRTERMCEFAARGMDYEARCLTCGAVAALYVDGIWTS